MLSSTMSSLGMKYPDTLPAGVFAKYNPCCCFLPGIILLPNLKVGGHVFPNTSRLEAVYGHSLIINPYQGMYQEIHPCMAGSIGSVEINTSLLMMRE